MIGIYSSTTHGLLTFDTQGNKHSAKPCLVLLAFGVDTCRTRQNYKHTPRRCYYAHVLSRKHFAIPACSDSSAARHFHATMDSTHAITMSCVLVLQLWPLTRCTACQCPGPPCTPISHFLLHTWVRRIMFVNLRAPIPVQTRWRCSVSAIHLSRSRRKVLNTNRLQVPERNPCEPCVLSVAQRGSNVWSSFYFLGDFECT